jgi:hypothetical protein
MATSVRPTSVAADRQWFIVGRWQEFEGEGRTNLLRTVGIAAFYCVELINYYGLDLGFVQFPQIRNRPFHLAVTALAVAWTMAALAVQICLSRSIFPERLKFLSTGCDIFLLTSVLTVADGPRSPLIVAYFLIVALAALRFSVPLVKFATFGSMAGYLVLLGYAKWFTSRTMTVPRYHELIVLVALGLTGITIGQVVRRARSLAEDYASRLAAAAKEPRPND